MQHLFTGFEKVPSLSLKLTGEGRIGVAPQDGADLAGERRMITAPEALKRAEAELYRSALEAAGGNVSAAARQLGLTRAKLEYRLTKLGLLT
jgi:two-component system response regulator HydG